MLQFSSADLHVVEVTSYSIYCTSSTMPPRRDFGQAKEVKQSNLHLLYSPLSWCYRVQLFKNKGAFLVLLWTFSGLSVYNQLVNKIGSNLNISSTNTLFGSNSILSPAVVVNASVFIYPLLGWLADVHCGRYSVIKYSLWAMWLMSVLFCLASVILRLLTAYKIVSDTDLAEEVVSIVLHVAIALGLGGFQANIVQFGIDQLMDASSGEITSFIRWYGWVWFLSEFLVAMTQNCLCHGYEVIYQLMIPALLSIVLCLDYFCVDWLFKEPVSKNPLVMIFQVLKYAVKNKYPRRRSAFTYWDNKQYSRINLAKTEFGGPFTAQQVEDVKTFWRILLVLSIGCLFAGNIVHINEAKYKLSYHLRDDNYSNASQCSSNCFWRHVIEKSGSCFIIAFVPLFEFFLYPLFKRHFKVQILKKFALGMFFILLTVCSYGTIEAVGHYHNKNDLYINTTCLLNLTSYQADSVLSLSYAWMIFPDVTYYIGDYLLLITAGEFLCAQSPYSMKGLLFGTLYLVIGISVVLNLAWLLPIQYAIKKWSSSTQVGCGALYFSSIFGLLFVIVISFCCVCKCYKKRLRDEDERISEIFVVDYSSQND